MALLAVQQVTLAGLDVNPVSATSGGDTAPVGDRTYLHVINGSGSAVTVTLATTQTVSGLAVADVTHSVPAGKTTILPLFPATLLADSTGICSITYSAVTSVTVAVVRG
jgi:hypothetical protein